MIPTGRDPRIVEEHIEPTELAERRVELHRGWIGHVTGHGKSVATGVAGRG